MGYDQGMRANPKQANTKQISVKAMLISTAAAATLLTAYRLGGKPATMLVGLILTYVSFHYGLSQSENDEFAFVFVGLLAFATVVAVSVFL